MANATGEAESDALRLQFDRSVKLAFHGSAISSDGGLLLHRELDDALGLTDMGAVLFTDPRTGRNGRHRLIGFLRQSIFSRLGGYEDVNDADGQLNMHALLTLLEGFVRQNAVVGAYKWEKGMVGVGRRTMQVNVRKIVCNRETQARFVFVFEGITDR